MSNKIPLSEYTKTDSNYSMTRLMLSWCVKAGIVIAILGILGYIIVAIITPPHIIDLGAVGVLVGVLTGGAFIGKSVQSFAEKETPTQPQSVQDK